MMKAIKVLLTLAVFIQFVSAQCLEYDLQPPQLRDIIVKSHITQDKNTTIFTFRYTITNGTSSTGRINGFEMDITYPSNAAQLPSTGLIDCPKYIDRVRREGIIPIGIPQLPRMGRFSNVWSVGFGVDGTVDWFRRFENFKLEPGSTLDSMILTTYGLPGLRSFIVSPSYNPKPPVEVTPENEDSIRANVPWTYEDEMEFQRLLDSIKWRGITVGPTAPPKDFTSLIWCDTLLSYTRQSSELGWLLDMQTRNKIEKKNILAKLLLEKANQCKSGPEPDTLIDETSIALDNEEVILKMEYGEDATNQISPAAKNEKDIKVLNRYKNEMSKNPKERKLNKIQCKDLCEKVYKHLAIRTLQSLVREVEILNKLSDRNKKQYLTSEAYALLKYNTEYLIEQLKK